MATNYYVKIGFDSNQYLNQYGQITNGFCSIDLGTISLEVFKKLIAKTGSNITLHCLIYQGSMSWYYSRLAMGEFLYARL